MIKCSSSPRRAAGWMLVGATGFAVMSTGVKVAADVATPLQTAFLRSAFGALLVLPLLMLSAERPVWSRWRVHVVRGSAGIVSMLLYFSALTMLPVSTAMALNSTSGLFLPALAWVVLSERPSLRVAIGLGCGFAGVLILVSPSAGNNSLGSLLALASGLALALAHLSIRRLSLDREPVLVQVLAFNLIGTVITGLLLLPTHGPAIGLTAAGLGIGIAAAATLGQFGLVNALALGPAAPVAAMGFLSLALAAFLDMTLTGTLPSRAAWAGMSLVLLGAWVSNRFLPRSRG